MNTRKNKGSRHCDANYPMKIRVSGVSRNYPYNTGMKFFLIGLITFFLAASPAWADNAISVYLYKADPAAPEGFSEVYRWRMNKSDEFRRFEYMTTKMRKGEKDKINPYTRKPTEMLVLSVKDENGITGKDYYLTPDGIMITLSTAHNKYFDDNNNFYKFLKEEVIHHSTLEKFPGEKIASDAQGVITRYLINETLPNPAWLINTQKDVNLYDSFLRKLSPIKVEKFKYRNPFDTKGNFVVMLNYPKAPAKYATINNTAIRLSDTYSEDKFVRDDEKYYKFFYRLTKESLDNTFETQESDEEKKRKGNF